MTKLNQLILLEDIINSTPKEHSYILVKSDFHGLSKDPENLRDLGFSRVDLEKAPSKGIIKDFYLIPLWFYQTFNEKIIYERILSSAFGDEPFLRYLIKTNQREEPELIEEKEGGIKFGPVKYETLKLNDLVKKKNLVIYSKIIDLLKKEKKIIEKFL